MALIESLIGPIASTIDKIIPDKEARAKGKLQLLAVEGTQELKAIEAPLSAIVAEVNSKDPWISRVRPSFLFVMYTITCFRCRCAFSRPSPPRPRRISAAESPATFAGCRKNPMHSSAPANSATPPRGNGGR